MTWEERTPDAPAMTLLRGIKTGPSPATHRQLLSRCVEAASAATVDQTAVILHTTSTSPAKHGHHVQVSFVLHISLVQHK